jgi:hypothetical protein
VFDDLLRAFPALTQEKAAGLAYEFNCWMAAGGDVHLGTDPVSAARIGYVAGRLDERREGRVK